MIRLTPSDRSVLAQARIVGIGDGFTVPTHVPGEITGSCSFAMDSGEPFPRQLHSIAQILGAFAFEAARLCSVVHAREDRLGDLANPRHQQGNGDPAPEACARTLRRPQQGDAVGPCAL
jgi:LuxR family quorum-sensing system transcriptional regulator CciR